MASEAFEKVQFRGRLMDRKTQAFLEAMEKKLGYELTVVQGCYNAGAVSASAGTHDGGGVVDLVAWDQRRKVKVARELGAFAWYRPDLPGVWGEHIHLGVRDHGKLAPSAKNQQADYDGDPPRNGLANNGLDRTFHPDPEVTFKFQANQKAPDPDPDPEGESGPGPNRVTRARDALATALHSLGDAAALLDATDESREAVKKQIGELKALRQSARDLLEKLPKS